MPARYTCPVCRATLEAVPQGRAYPQPGAVLLCCECETALVLSPRHALRILTLAEFHGLPPEEQRDIRAARGEGE